MSTDTKKEKRLVCPVCGRDLMLESTYLFRLVQYKVNVECGNQHCRMYRKTCGGMGPRYEAAKSAAYYEIKRRAAVKKKRDVIADAVKEAVDHKAKGD